MKHLTTPRSPVSCSSIVGHKVDPRETAQKTAVKASGKKKKRTGARNISKLTNVHLLEKVGPGFGVRGSVRSRDAEVDVFDRVSTCRRITCQSRRGAAFSYVWRGLRSKVLLGGRDNFRRRVPGKSSSRACLCGIVFREYGRWMGKSCMKRYCPSFARRMNKAYYQSPGLSDVGRTED